MTKRWINFLFVLFVTFLLIAYLALASNAHAVWTKHPSNPILPLGSPGSWDSRHVVNPIILKENNKYHIWYDGSRGNLWKIGYAFSLDGVKNWQRNKLETLDIGTSDGWENEVGDSFVLKDDSGVYHMWYTSLNKHWVSGVDRFRVRHATSQDGIIWVRDVGWVMQGDIGSWDEGGMARGRSILNKDGKYHMWYSATNDDDLSRDPYWRIGYATSVDGISWEKHPNNPVVTPTKSWELNNVSYPNVIYENGKFKMTYAAGLDDLPIQLVYAESFDGVNWTKPSDENPVLTRTPSSFDSTNLASPFVIRDGSSYKMYYSGFNGSWWQIGLATREFEHSSVPSFKQTDISWSENEYDSASKIYQDDPTIGRWGCAVTSAAMILNYFGYTKLPDGATLDPGSLNNWLSSQPDGYIGNGWVNWIALTRLSMLAVDVNGITDFDALEYSRSNSIPTNHEVMLPAIIEEPGHFFVATSSNGTTISINDPYYDRETIQNNHNIRSFGYYEPSKTDLSYLLLTYDISYSIAVYDETGKEVGSEFLQSPIQDPATSANLGTTQKIYVISKPTDGKFSVKILSEGKNFLRIEGFAYDSSGKVEELVFPKGFGANSTLFSLHFTKLGDDETIIEKNVSFKTLLSELKLARKAKLIDKKAFRPLYNLISNTQKQHKSGRLFPAKLRLKTIQSQVSKTFGRFIQDEYEETLKLDIQTLLAQI